MTFDPTWSLASPAPFTDLKPAQQFQQPKILERTTHTSTGEVQVMQSETSADSGSRRHKLPDWEMAVETELVRRNLEECYKGEPRPMVPPIHPSSTFPFENSKEGEKLSGNKAKTGYLYTRWGNPTVDAAAEVIARLEGAKGTLLFPSGVAAITTSLLSFAKAGDHIVACCPVYGGTNGALRSIISNLGVEVTWVKSDSIEDFKKNVKSNTKILYGETPTNPTMSILDLEAFGALGKSLPGVVTMVDATFASPYLSQPVKLGVDLAIHSCTKYLGGHTDLVGGSVSYATEELGDKLKYHQILLGPCQSPFDAYLLYRSMKTLALRMDRHCENAMKVAEYLEKHPKIECVYYPGLASHPGHEIAKKQMKRGFSGMMSFKISGGYDDSVKFVESLKVATMAVSLGGVETLICHPASTTHHNACVSPETKKLSGITDNLIRLSVGVENIGDIIKDLEQALDKI